MTPRPRPARHVVVAVRRVVCVLRAVQLALLPLALTASCVDAPSVDVDGGVLDADPDAGPDADDVARVAACAPLSPGSVSLTTVEAEGGFDEELLSTNLHALPPTVDISGQSSFSLLMLRYMLESADVVDVNVEAAKASSLLAWSAVAALRDDGVDADASFLRRGLFRFYACERGFPLTLAGFKETIHDFTTDGVADTVDSRVKGLPRRIYRNAEAGTFVAETIDNDVVRETEIILTDRRRDARIDFLEYDHDGVLVGASRFVGSNGTETTAAVPFGCITCHGTDVVSPASP